MKRVILSLSAVFALVVIFTVFSCEKAIISNENESGDAKGNLKVTVFEIEKTPFASLTRTVENASAVVTRLNFAVYDTDGARLKQVNQELGKNADFGTASFQLEEGTYQLVVVGHSSNGNPTMTNPAKIQFDNSDGYSDTFLYSEDVTIVADPVNLSLTLHRIVALCRFVITDDYPQDVAKMQFKYTGGSGAFDATTGLGCVNSKQEHVFDIIDGQKQFDLYTFLHSTEGTIRLTVTVYDHHDNVLYERTFTDVPMQQNHITWYSGNYFTGGSGTTNISITINTEWDGESHLTF